MTHGISTVPTLNQLKISIFNCYEKKNYMIKTCDKNKSILKRFYILIAF